jgi:hypothetical protein
VMRRTALNTGRDQPQHLSTSAPPSSGELFLREFAISLLVLRCCRLQVEWPATCYLYLFASGPVWSCLLAKLPLCVCVCLCLCPDHLEIISPVRRHLVHLRAAQQLARLNSHCSPPLPFPPLPSSSFLNPSLQHSLSRTPDFVGKVYSRL